MTLPARAAPSAFLRAPAPFFCIACLSGLSVSPVLSQGVSHSTLPGVSACLRYNGIMRYTLIPLAVLLLRTFGCDSHPLTDYRPLDQAGMWSSNVEQLKALNTSDTEISQLAKLKQAGISDDACVTIVSD